MHRIKDFLKEKAAREKELKQQFLTGRKQGVLAVIAEISRVEDKTFAIYLLRKWKIEMDDLNLLDKYDALEVLPLLYQQQTTAEYVRKSISAIPHIIA